MRGWTCLIGGAVFAVACAAASPPDPRVALAQYEAALARNDAKAMHALLDADARAAVSVEEVQAWLAESRPVLQARAKAWRAASSHVVTRAQVQYPDGESAELTLEEGQFKIAAAAALPAAAHTPEQALVELRRALAARSYPALSRVLTQQSASALEQQLLGLIQSLEHPEALPIQVNGSRATLQTATGHKVELELQDGVWKVRDFE
jgi:hypothetical protein